MYLLRADAEPSHPIEELVGGLIFSQLPTLFTTPSVRLYLDRLGIWWSDGMGRCFLTPLYSLDCDLRAVSFSVSLPGDPNLSSGRLRIHSSRQQFSIGKRCGVTQDPMVVRENIPSHSVFPVGKGRSSSFSSRKPWSSSKARR